MDHRTKYNLASAVPTQRATVGWRWRYFPHLFALTCYALLAVVVTWPIAANITSGIVGAREGIDAFQDAWNVWWNARALSQGQLPFRTTMLYYPQGIDMFWQTLGFSQGLLAAPITLLFGPLAGFNITELSSFVIGGFATFLLARRVTGSTPAALLAGAIFAFSPYHIDKLIEGNLPLTSLHWLPCYMLALYLLLERPTWVRALVSGLLLLWLSLGSWYYAMFCVVFTGCAVGVWALSRGRQGFLRTALWGAVPLVMWGVILAPKLLGLAQGGDELMDMRSLIVSRSADLIDFFLPNPHHPLWGASVQAARDRIYPNGLLWNVSLGWVALPLAVVGIAGVWQRSWRWAVLLLATMILAMGPTLRIAGNYTGIPLPFALIQDLPGIRAGQRPNHIIALGSLMAAILAAFGFTALTRRLPERAVWLIAGALILAAVYVDGYGGELTIVRRPPHPFFQSLPEPDGGLLALPAYVNVNRSENLTAQMTHRWPIVAGYVARPPAYPFPAHAPGVREILYGGIEPDDVVSPGWPEAGRRTLAAYAFRYVTFDLTSNKPEYFAEVRQTLKELGVGAPLVADDKLEAYAIPRSWPVQPVVYLGDGWQSLERQSGTVYRWRWMGENAKLVFFNPYAQPTVATVTLQLASYGQSRDVKLMLDNQTLTQMTVSADGPTTHRFTFVLAPGEHHLALSAPATVDTARNNQAISIRAFGISATFGEPISVSASDTPAR